jgi:hypothetical protein
MNRKRLAAALAYVDEKAKRLTSLDQPKESDAVDMALEMGGSFIPGVGQALAARDFERARRAGDEAGMGMAAASALPVGRLIGALKGFDPVMREIDVYHGSPHRFDEFDASKIGTGEGAQAYGHGIYLAESPDVAKTYQSAQSPSARKATMTLQASDGNVNKAIAAMKKEVATMTAHKDSPYLRQGAFQETQDALNYLQQMKKGAAPQTGALYTADLPDEMVDRMLDWDKPLIEQRPILKALTEMANRDRTGASAVAARTARSILQRAGQAADSYGKDKVTGASLYDSFLADEIPDQAQRSQFLKDLGIPGIRYLDAGSRGQGGSGTRNFVVFPGEEKKVKILKRE